MGEKILIVEDNPQSMRLIEMILKAEDYTLLKAIDGEEALDIAEKEYPDLILMDVQLPDMDGMTVVRMLRENKVTKDIIILALTAYAMKGDKERMLRMGCDDYISKPIDVQGFINTVRRFLSSKTETEK